MHLHFQNITEEINIATRTRSDQHKCLPLLACINSTPLLFQKNVVDSKNDSII